MIGAASGKPIANVTPPIAVAITFSRRVQTRESSTRMAPTGQAMTVNAIAAISSQLQTYGRRAEITSQNGRVADPVADRKEIGVGLVRESGAGLPDVRTDILDELAAPNGVGPGQ